MVVMVVTIKVTDLAMITPHVGTFDTAQRRVLNLLQNDAFPRFLRLWWSSWSHHCIELETSPTKPPITNVFFQMVCIPEASASRNVPGTAWLKQTEIAALFVNHFLGSNLWKICFCWGFQLRRCSSSRNSLRGMIHPSNPLLQYTGTEAH